MKKKLKKTLINRIKKISSIDILSLFFIFFVAAGSYFFFSRKTEYLDITIRLFNQDTPEYYLDSNQSKSWYIEQIKKGKTQKNQIGETLIEITDVYSYPNGYIYNDVYVTLRVKAIQNKITKQYIYEGSPLLIHDVKSFKIQDLLINGEIIDLTNKAREKKKFKVVFELIDKRTGYDFTNNSESMIKGINNYAANLMVDGLSIKDSDDNEIVKVNRVEKKLGERIIATSNGLFSINDPDRTRVLLYTDLVAEKINGFYFYRKEETLMIDQQIHLTFDKVTLIGKITAIEGM